MVDEQDGGEHDGAEAADAEAADESDGHEALPDEDLQYPEFVFDDGDIEVDGGLDLRRDLDREAMADWLADLAGGLASHDVAVEAPGGYVTFGVGAGDVEMAFDPDEDGVGDLEVTFSLSAKPMFVADDPDGAKVGARAGTGFIPIEALTTDRETFRCYNWIPDPTAGDGTDETASGEDGEREES